MDAVTHFFTIIFRDITIVHYGIEYEQANSERSEKNGQFRITLRMSQVKTYLIRYIRPNDHLIKPNVIECRRRGVA